jgi:hypothetical protein
MKKISELSFYDICGYGTIVLLILGAFVDSLSVIFLMLSPITMMFWILGQCAPVQETKPAAAIQKVEKNNEVKEIVLYHDTKPVSGWLENAFGNLLLQVCESEIIKIKA